MYTIHDSCVFQEGTDSVRLVSAPDFSKSHTTTTTTTTSTTTTTTTTSTTSTSSTY